MAGHFLPGQRRSVAKACAGVRVRLHDTRGFLLAEQLVSIVFIGLLCVAVAAGLTAALSAYQAITKQTDAQQMLARAVDEVNGELAYARSNDGNWFVSSTTNTVVRMESTDDGGIVLQGREPSLNSEVLVGAARGLLPAFESGPTYDSDTNAWSYTLVVRDSGMVDVFRQEMTVAQMNPAGSSG